MCKDGFKVSIQASRIHYCCPRENQAEYYNEVELGYPNEVDELILPYAEEPDKPTKTVYGYTPVEIVDQLLEKHGGIDEDYVKKIAEEDRWWRWQI